MAVTQKPTSYEAQGSQPFDVSGYRELGANATQGIIRESLPQFLNRRTALTTYTQMKRGDAQIRATLKAIKMPIIGGEAVVEPASDSQLDIDVAEFVEYNLFNMSTTFDQVLYDALTCCEYGSSVLEKVFINAEWAPKREKANRKKYNMLRKLAFRPPLTILAYNYDANGGPASVTHQKYDPSNPTAPPQNVDIPIDRLVIFTYEKEGGNLEGLSVLRSAYQHWYYKGQLYKIDGIQKERHGIGVPIMSVPPGASSADKLAALALLQGLRTNENAAALEMFGWEIKFAKLEGQLVDVLGSAMHHDLMIARNVLAQFLNVGASESGTGRANTAAQSDIFQKSLEVLINLIFGNINQYVVRQLVNYNFDVARYPKLKMRGIGSARDIQMISAALRNLYDASILTPDFELEQWARDILLSAPKKLGTKQTPTPAQDSRVAPTPAAIDTGAGTQPAGTGNGQAATGTQGKGPSEP